MICPKCFGKGLVFDRPRKIIKDEFGNKYEDTKDFPTWIKCSKCQGTGEIEENER